MMRRIGIVLGGLAALGAAVAATPGTAGTGGGKTVVTTTGDPTTGLQISVTAAPGQANAVVWHDKYQPFDQGGGIVDRSAGITEDSEFCTQVSPTEVRCYGTTEAVDIKLGDGPDRTLMSSAEVDTNRLARGAPLPEVNVFLGAGNDRSLMSTAEIDTQVKGQAGRDRLIGREGDQALSGGGGPDFLAGGAGDGDVCNGGPAADKKGEGCDEVISIP